MPSAPLNTGASCASAGPWRLLVENALEIALVLDEEALVLHANPAACRAFGRESQDLLKHSLLRSIESHDRAGFQRVLQQVQASPAASLSVRFRVHRQNQSLRTLEGRLASLPGTGICLNAWDTTEQVVEAETNRKIQTRLEEAHRLARLGHWEWDVPSGALYWSKEIFRIFGRDPKEFEPTYNNFLLCVHPQDRPDVVRAVEHALQHRSSYKIDHRILNPDGSICLVHEQAEVIQGQDGNAVRMVGTVQDITERVESLTQLRLLSRAVEQAVDHVMITNRQGIIEYVNPSFLQQTGYRMEEIIGATPRLLKSGKHEAKFYQRLWSTISAGLAFHGEIINRKKNGDLYVEEKTITPIKSEEGVITHFVSTSKDITQQQLLEEQLRQTQKLEAIGKLAGGIAHDFNNLMTVVTCYSQLLSDSLGRGSPLQEDLEPIRKAAEQASALTRQLLAFSRKQILSPRLLDLNDIIRDTIKLLRPLLGEDIRLELDLDPAALPIHVDFGQIEQVLMNLAVNSRDAMQDGGTLAISTRLHTPGSNPVVEEFLTAAEGLVHLEVKDTGCGMEPEVMKHVFEPFFTTKPAGKGTGLGLSTVYGIVRQSGGTIQISSTPRVGTTFHIFLPVHAPPPVATAGTDTGSQSSQSAGEMILVVEDEGAARNLIGRILSRDGYRVRTAADAEEALNWFKAGGNELPVLLLTDVVLPKMKGPELAQRLKNVAPGLEVIYMSGYTDSQPLLEAIAVSDVHFLQKPFTIEQLQQKVRVVLEDRNRRHRPDPDGL